MKAGMGRLHGSVEDGRAHILKWRHHEVWSGNGKVKGEEA